jgi:hypothetical protein
MDDLAQVKKLSHELGHVRLHDPVGEAREHHRGIREVEAESVALMIGVAHGVDTTSYTVPYVAGWASAVKDKSPAEVVIATGERVRRAVNSILDALDTIQVPDGTPTLPAHQIKAGTSPIARPVGYGIPTPGPRPVTAAAAPVGGPVLGAW